MASHEHIVIGTREEWGQELPFALLQHDRRHHLYTLGKSGAGKTTLLRNLIIQDIEAGHGVAVIDPHGDLANDILDHIPRRRIEDVAYFNPADMEFPIGFNFLESTPPDRRHLVASGIVSVFKAERRDFFLYVDEFQSFASDSFASILSEARKYRLCLTLSHQYVEQVRPTIRDAVFGNVGSIVAFRVGHNDAKQLEQAFGETYRANQLTSLGNHEVCIKMLADGRDCEPFLGRTLPPLGESYGRRETIIRRSREKYAIESSL